MLIKISITTVVSVQTRVLAPSVLLLDDATDTGLSYK